MRHPMKRPLELLDDSHARVLARIFNHVYYCVGARVYSPSRTSIAYRNGHARVADCVSYHVTARVYVRIYARVLDRVSARMRPTATPHETTE
jgi:hypothetical protein